MASIGVEERRARLGRRHGLAWPLSSVEAAVEAMVVLHASDPASVFLSALARLAEPSIEVVEDALYEARVVARTLAMRRTLFVVPRSFLWVVERSSSDGVAARERGRLLQAMVDSGFEDPEAWLDEAAAAITDALADGGLPARTLTRRVPMLARKLTLGAGSKWSTEVGATSRVVAQLAIEGLLMRGRPAGDWTGRQYRWHLRSEWLGAEAGAEVAGSSAEDGGAAEGVARLVEETGSSAEEAGPAEGAARRAEDGREERGFGKEAASVELVRAWLARFGPGTIDDLKWWTGWTMGQLRPALAALDPVEVDLDGATGLVLPDDLEPTPTPEPWAALLPALDPTPMGWKERAWYLGPHQQPLFDRNGNIGPTVWVDGRIVGGWAQRPDGTIVTRLLEDVGADRQALIEARVGALEAVIGSTVVKPSFPTPLLRELAASS